MNNLDLQKLVEEISVSFFNKLFRHKAVFNPRLRSTGGRYLLRTHNIEINKKYFDQLGKEELIGIIKHELCHYHLHLDGKGYQHRDLDFKKLLKKVDAPRHCSHLPDSKLKKRSIKKILIYECSKCYLQYRRVRKMNTDRFVCGKCKGKLVMKEVILIQNSP